MPEENYLPIDIEDKFDSPELIALIQAYGSQSVLTAEEFNQFKRGVNHLYQVFIDNAGVVLDADAQTKGVLKLAGDLSGTAEAPTVPGLANKVDKPALPGNNAVLIITTTGSSTTAETYEFLKPDPTNVPYNTINELINDGGYSNANNVLKGTQVMCPNLDPPRMYFKYGDNDTEWKVFYGNNLPLS